MTDSLYRTLDDNWKWYKDNYMFEYRTKDLLDGTVKPEDQERYDLFKQQVIKYRGSDDILEHDKRTPQWYRTDRKIVRWLKEAWKKNKDIRWVKEHAKVSESTYDRHLFLSENVSALHNKIRARNRHKKTFDKKVTVCIDMQTYKRYEFDSRTDCDHYFDWPTGTASQMISTKKHYHHHYWIFDKEEEEKVHGKV